MRQPAALALALSLAIPGLAAASGSSGMTSPRQQMPTATPEQEAVEYYNDGISYRDKADKYEKEAAAENDAAKKAKLLEKSKSQHESSIKKYLKAVAKDPQMVPAWGSLGYAYRKTGNYSAPRSRRTTRRSRWRRPTRPRSNTAPRRISVSAAWTR